MREFPERINLQLANAAKAAGLKEVQIEWPTEGAEGERHILWYDVSGISEEGLRWCLEIQPGGKKSWIQKHMQEGYLDKIEWTILNGCAFLEIPAFGHNTQTMTILIKEAMMKRRQNERPTNR